MTHPLIVVIIITIFIARQQRVYSIHHVKFLYRNMGPGVNVFFFTRSKLLGNYVRFTSTKCSRVCPEKPNTANNMVAVLYL